MNILMRECGRFITVQLVDQDIKWKSMQIISLKKNVSSENSLILEEMDEKSFIKLHQKLGYKWLSFCSLHIMSNVASSGT